MWRLVEYLFILSRMQRNYLRQITIDVRFGCAPLGAFFFLYGCLSLLKLNSIICFLLPIFLLNFL